MGDNLTYWILDEQSKRLLARSVVRPFENNKRVKWDPALDGIASDKHTAHNGGERLNDQQHVKAMLAKCCNDFDDHDDNEVEPTGHPICVTECVPTPKPNNSTSRGDMEPIWFDMTALC